MTPLTEQDRYHLRLLSRAYAIIGWLGVALALLIVLLLAFSKRAARSGRNPRTGDAIKIKAAKVPKFRPGKALKDALN